MKLESGHLEPTALRGLVDSAIKGRGEKNVAAHLASQQTGLIQKNQSVIIRKSGGIIQILTRNPDPVSFESRLGFD
ncbi:MAG: hypothetical protein MUO27_01280 [Sedimentisphaerales bacterium]|nr:hypothetical protein [Sedimentisphaerales bacterium]